MEDSGAGADTMRKKLKHRLTAILSVFSRRVGRGRKRRNSEDEAKLPPPLAFPSRHTPRLGISGKKLAGGNGNGIADRRLFVEHVPPLPSVARWKERASTNTASRRLSTHSSRQLVSSSSSDDEYDEDSRNLFSSDFYNCPRKNATTRAPARASVSGPCRAPPPASVRCGASQSYRYSFELPRGSTASAATDGGFTVVKGSGDPYEDFRKSMQEMIVEWPAAGGDGNDGEGEQEHSAERLLETYLVLNSPRHYPAILAAFAGVRETLFP